MIEKPTQHFIPVNYWIMPKLFRICLSVVFLFGFYSVAYSADKPISKLTVIIPFCPPNGNAPPATMEYNLNAGKYYITLKVDRATWDKPGVADLVPIGLNTYTKNAKGQKQNVTPWKTGLGFASTEIEVVRKTTLYVAFSTSAPLGARGVLEMIRRE